MADTTVDAVPAAPPSHYRADATNNGEVGVVAASLLGVLDSTPVAWAPIVTRLVSTRTTSGQ